MIELNLITYTWNHKENLDLRLMHSELLEALEAHFVLQFTDHRDFTPTQSKKLSVVFIASGGVDLQIMRDFEKLPRPLFMLTDGLYNSLPTALEMQRWCKEKGIKSEILHGDNETIIERLHCYHRNSNAYFKMRGTRVGIIGSPSPWLISAHADHLICKSRWGIVCENVPITEVTERYEAINDDQALMIAAKLSGKAEMLTPETIPDDLFKSIRLYLAIRDLVETHNYQAISVSCLRILEKTGIAGCLALSLLNDEEIIAGSEGDMQTLFTQIVAYILTGKKAALVIPGSINREKNQFTVGSCNVRFKQKNEYIPSNLFHNGSGNTEAFELTPGNSVTLLKCGGECLDEYYISSGELIPPVSSENGTRTFPSFRPDSSIETLLQNPLGSHYTLIPGDHQHTLHDFLSSYNCKRV